MKNLQIAILEFQGQLKLFIKEMKEKKIMKSKNLMSDRKKVYKEYWTEDFYV